MATTTTDIDIESSIASIRDRIGILPATEYPSMLERVAELESRSRANKMHAAISSGNPRRIWPEMNYSLNTVQATTYMYPAPVYWTAELLRRGVTSGVAYDIGCGNGLGTCTLASLAPEIALVGIDPDKRSIARAREMTDLLGLGNVEFRSDASLLEPADVVLSSMAVHEIADMDSPWDDYTDFDPAQTVRNRIAAVAVRYATLLKDGGRVYSVERFPDVFYWQTWVDGLAAGFDVALDECAYARWETSNGTEYFPVTVATKTGAGRTIDAAELEARWTI